VITSRRIVKARYASGAFDGEGARIAGGRWNSPGVAMVYTSETTALAALELLVHLGRSRSLADYVVFGCTFDDALVLDLPVNDLPRNWRTYPAPPALQEVGDEWIRHGRSAVLRVPSVIVGGEFNFLLNPAHPDFAGIRISDPQRFDLDLRLLP